MNLRICFPVHFSGQRISYTCNLLSKHMDGPGLSVEVTAPSCAAGLDNRTLRPILPSLVGRGLGYMDRERLIRFTENVFLRRLQDDDPVYLWSQWTPEFLERLARTNSTIFAEKFNGLAAAAKDLLDVAYERAGLAPAHGIDEEFIRRDLDRIQAADYVFVANPVSATSMVDYGVPPEKIVSSSFGWDPSRMTPPLGFVRKDHNLTFVFVGVAEIRKGANLLLDAWVRAKLDATLVIAGPVSEEVRDLCADLLDRDDVVQLGWTEALAEVYHSADVFVFPTHEEGGPLVTFEAMGCGLPVIVSPMGATTVVRDGLDGFVIDPYDIEAWVGAMRRLAGDADLRAEMGHNARKRALQFTWDKVGAQRRQAVLERVGSSCEARDAGTATVLTSETAS